MGWDLLYETFGFDPTAPYKALFVIGIFWQRIGYFLRPLYTSLSRRFECQADAFAARLLGTSQPLVTALKRLASDNLANISPHPLYVWFNYSHPPLLERIKLLDCLEPSLTVEAGKNPPE
jgi:STE24 endopeptidase